MAGREMVVGAHWVLPTHMSLLSALGVSVKMGISRGMEAGTSLGHNILASQEFHWLPPSSWAPRGQVICSETHSESTESLTLHCPTAEGLH